MEVNLMKFGPDLKSSFFSIIAKIVSMAGSTLKRRAELDKHTGGGGI